MSGDEIEIPHRLVVLQIMLGDTLLVLPVPSVDAAMEMLAKFVEGPLVSETVVANKSHGWKLYQGLEQVAAIVIRGGPPDRN